MKVIVIIPARGGSKGIPRKNLRLLNKKPLIWYPINIAKRSIYNPDIVVSTDDTEIGEVAYLFGARKLKRPKDLAADDVTLDPVVYHAVVEMERRKHIKYDLVVTLQPTAPLLKAETLDKAILFMINNSYDTILSVERSPHLYWKQENGVFVPLYKRRENRQFLNPLYKENGAFVISKRNILTSKSRIGNNVYLFEVPKEESIDIDSYSDWWIAENYLSRMNIIFRVDGDTNIGLGHVYRALTLASRIGLKHNILFLMDRQKTLGIRKVKEFNYPVATFKDSGDMFLRMREFNADIIINDILDTEKQYISRLKKENYFVVNFEDMGEGSEVADLVINALYENSNPPTNHYYGYKYVCLRDDFLLYRKKNISRNVKRILVVFGGTDPNNLTMKTLRAIEKLGLKEISFRVILGMGYNFEKELKKYVHSLLQKGFKISVKKNIKTMAKEISKADIVITSNGRTIYEIASLGIPCISIAQNERESKHLFVHYSKAVEYLGMAYNINEGKIALAIQSLIKDFALRKIMHKKLLSFELQEGTERVVRLILNEYFRWKEKKS